jgi:tetratricopeptide (TPR) repeat protein
MKIAKQITTVIVLIVLATPLFAADDDTKAFGQFQGFLEGMDQKSFEMMQDYIDQTDLTNRILSHQSVQPDVEQAFRSDFWNIIETGVAAVLPPEGSKVKGELIQFEFEDGQGRACVRFAYPNHNFQFRRFELRHDRRGRLKISDWFDSNKGLTFSALIGEELLTAKPTKEATRRLLSIETPSDLQLFQATELLKAIRDHDAPRFFDIYNEFDDQLKKVPWIAKNAVSMAHDLKDIDRFARTLEIFADVFADDPDMALLLSDYYLIVQDYERALTALQRFEQHFAVNEGALPARLSAIALAAGKLEEAETFAVAATTNEPKVELGWWSLLRVRTAAKDYQGALAALTYLEDNFGHRLDARKLRRDKFRAFTKLASSQEFKDWRAGRD